MAIRFSRVRRQKDDHWFFSRLPQEIRRLIYEELFGRRVIHIMHYSSKEAEELVRENRPKTKIPGWVHCVCRRHLDTAPHQHSESHHKWCYISTSFLFTCKQAFEEGMTTLYGSNMLIFRTADEFTVFWRMNLHYNCIVKRLGFQINMSDLLPSFETILQYISRSFDFLEINVRISLLPIFLSVEQVKKSVMSQLRSLECLSNPPSEFINIALILPPGYAVPLSASLRRAGMDHVVVEERGPVQGDGNATSCCEASDDEYTEYVFF